MSIENPDADAYSFESTEEDVDGLGDEEAGIVDFVGTHTETASIAGTMFLDEVDVDGEREDGEPAFAYEIPLLLSTPEQKVVAGSSDGTGAFVFEGLKAGSYRVAVAQSDALTGALAKAGYKFAGELLGEVVVVPAATEARVAFPFRITKQTINVGANLATKTKTGDAMGGVGLALYPTAEDAEDGTNSLGSATTSGSGTMKGMAKFEFDRAKDEGPGGGPTDHLVFAKVTRTPSDIEAHNGTVIEIEYEAVDRVTDAPARVKLVNTRASFQWWVKSDEDAKDGDLFLEGWKADVKAGSTTMASRTTAGTGRASYSGDGHVVAAGGADRGDGRDVHGVAAEEPGRCGGHGREVEGVADAQPQADGAGESVHEHGVEETISAGSR